MHFVLCIVIAGLLPVEVTDNERETAIPRSRRLFLTKGQTLP